MKLIGKFKLVAFCAMYNIINSKIRDVDTHVRHFAIINLTHQRFLLNVLKN